MVFRDGRAVAPRTSDSLFEHGADRCFPVGAGAEVNQATFLDDRGHIPADIRGIAFSINDGSKLNTIGLDAHHKKRKESPARVSEQARIAAQHWNGTLVSLTPVVHVRASPGEAIFAPSPVGKVRQHVTSDLSC